MKNRRVVEKNCPKWQKFSAEAGFSAIFQLHKKIIQNFFLKTLDVPQNVLIV